MYDDARRPVGLTCAIERVGNVVERDDLADARQWVQSARGDGVKGAVPVLRVRATPELDADALPGSRGDVQRVTGVPDAGTIDSGAHLGGFDDFLNESRRSDAFENHSRAGQSALGTNLGERLENRRLGGGATRAA